MLQINLLNCRGSRFSKTFPPLIDFPQLNSLHRLADSSGGVNERPLVAVQGPEGCGKTTFLREAQALLAANSVETIFLTPPRGFCTGAPRISPGSLWSFLFQKGQVTVSCETERSPAEVLPAGTRDLPPSLRRETLADFMVQALCRVSQAQPVGLLVDDFDLFSSTASFVLRKAIWAAHEGRLRAVFLVVASQGWIEKWRKWKVLGDCLTLKRFGKKELRRFFSHLEDSAALSIEELVDLTGGLPRRAFCLSSLLRDKLDAGLSPGDAGQLAKERPVELLRRRVAFLSALQKDVLAVLSLLGRPVRLSFLRRVLNVEREVLELQVCGLKEKGWVAKGENHTLRFTEQLGQKAVQSVLSAEQRKEWHIRLGASLKNSAVTCSEACFHLLKGGLRDAEFEQKAVEELLLAGDLEGILKLLQVAEGPQKAFGLESTAEGAGFGKAGGALIRDLCLDGRAGEALCLMEKPGFPKHYSTLLWSEFPRSFGETSKWVRSCKKELEAEASQKEESWEAEALIAALGDRGDKNGFAVRAAGASAKGRIGEAACLACCGLLLREGDTAKALKMLRERQGFKSRYVGWLWKAMAGSVCTRLGLGKEAKAWLEQSGRVASEAGLPVLSGRNAILEAERLLSAGRAGEAAGAVARAKKLLLGVPAGHMARVLLCQGVVSIWENEFHQAASSASLAAAAEAELKGEFWPGAVFRKQFSWSDCDLNVYKCFFQKGAESYDADSLEKPLLERLKKYRSCKDRENAAWTLQHLAQLFVLQGNDGVALSCVTESLKCGRGLPGPELRASSRLTAARVRILVGDYKGALRSLKEALQGFVLAYDLRGVVETTLTLAALFRVLGAYRLAWRYVSVSFQLAEALGGEQPASRIELERAHLALCLGRKREVYPILEGLNCPAEPWTQIEKKLILAQVEPRAEAVPLAQEAAAMARQTGAQDGAIEAALLLGKLKAGSGGNLIQGLEIIQGVLALARRRERPELGIRAEMAMGELFYMRGRKKPGEEFLRRAAEGLGGLLRSVPREFRGSFLAKPVYSEGVKRAPGGVLKEEGVCGKPGESWGKSVEKSRMDTP